MALIEVSSSITPVDPSEIFSDGFELSQQTIIPSQDYSGSFTPGLNNIEFLYIMPKINFNIQSIILLIIL